MKVKPGKTRRRNMLLVVLSATAVGLLVGSHRHAPLPRHHPLRLSSSAAVTPPPPPQKLELLAAIDAYNEATKADGTPSVDFGVSGGELDEESRAPRDLLAAGAFAAVSERVGAAAERVVSAVDALVPANPTAEPTKGLGKAKGFGYEDCPLNGRWYNKFTTAADATFSPDSKRGDAVVSNYVNGATGKTTNIIEFLPRDVPAFRATRKPLPPPPLDSLKVVLSARAASATRVELIFRRVRARLNLSLLRGRLKFALTLILPVPGPFLTRLLFFFRPAKRPPLAFFDVLYLDEDLRVHKTAQGNLFVQQRAPPPEGDLEPIEVEEPAVAVA